MLADLMALALAAAAGLCVYAAAAWALRLDPAREVTSRVWIALRARRPAITEAAR